MKPEDEDKLTRSTERRAKIAGSTASAKTKQEAWEQLGVEEFIWRTVGDDRVRSSHKDLDGKRFPITGHPTQGFPGERPGCRCTAERVFGPSVAPPTGRRGSERRRQQRLSERRQRQRQRARARAEQSLRTRQRQLAEQQEHQLHEDARAFMETRDNPRDIGRRLPDGEDWILVDQNQTQHSPRYACNPSSAVMVARRLGITRNFNIDEIYQDLEDPDVYGISMRDIAHFMLDEVSPNVRLKSFAGIQSATEATFPNNLPLEGLRRWVSSEYPAVVSVQMYPEDGSDDSEPFYHAVVVERLVEVGNRRFVAILDPEGGRSLWWPLHQFLARWHQAYYEAVFTNPHEETWP